MISEIVKYSNWKWVVASPKCKIDWYRVDFWMNYLASLIFSYIKTTVFLLLSMSVNTALMYLHLSWCWTGSGSKGNGCRADQNCRLAWAESPVPSRWNLDQETGHLWPSGKTNDSEQFIYSNKFTLVPP